MNAGLLHTILANWLGRGAHPVGMEATPGPEKWNYPVYSYAIDFAKRSSRQVEVKMNIAYAKDSNGEYQESPHVRRVKYFHYILTLDDQGRITGGSFYRDSSIIDMLWIPLRPKQGGRKGNEPGNPYVDVNKVLAIWRASVPEDMRKQWVTIDPPEEDRITDTAGIETLIPLQIVQTPGTPTTLPAAPSTASRPLSPSAISSSLPDPVPPTNPVVNETAADSSAASTADSTPEEPAMLEPPIEATDAAPATEETEDGPALEVPVTQPNTTPAEEEPALVGDMISG
jgi:hypothetical protein